MDPDLDGRPLGRSENVVRTPGIRIRIDAGLQQCLHVNLHGMYYIGR